MPFFAVATRAGGRRRKICTLRCQHHDQIARQESDRAPPNIAAHRRKLRLPGCISQTKGSIREKRSTKIGAMMIITGRVGTNLSRKQPPLLRSHNSRTVSHAGTLSRQFIDHKRRIPVRQPSIASFSTGMDVRSSETVTHVMAMEFAPNRRSRLMTPLLRNSREERFRARSKTGRSDNPNKAAG